MAINIPRKLSREIRLIDDEAAELSETLEDVELLSPGAINPGCFEISISPSNYSHITEVRRSFSQNVHHSSGCISEIRASTIEIEVASTVVQHVDQDPGAGRVIDELVETIKQVTVPEGYTLDDVDPAVRKAQFYQKDEQDAFHEETNEKRTHVEDADASFADLTCTSSFLPKEDSPVHHSVTVKNLRSLSREENYEDAEEEDVDYTRIESWRNERRQLFILSDSGKPIYSRHGEEDKLVTLCGVMQALVSVINDDEGNNLWSISALDTTISFLVRTPLVLVTVAKTDESDRQLLIYLNYAYDFILSVLTMTQLSRIFLKHKNFDLRRMLSGTEKILDHLIDWMDEDMGFLLGSARCLPLASTLRENVNSHLTHSCNKIPGLVFAIVLAKRQLISIARLKKYALHPSDIRLLINLIDASDSFKTAESWIPICLPKFDSSGFLHAYISYLGNSPVCVVYLGVDPTLFHALSKSFAMFSSKMESSGDLHSIMTAMSSTSYYSASQSGVTELRHFVYKSSSAAQLTSPFVTHPYLKEEQRYKLRYFYRYLHRRMHCPTRAAKIIVVSTNTEMLLGWVTAGFELYAILEPSITKHHAVTAIEKLIKWIKKEEHHLFILNSPVFS